MEIELRDSFDFEMLRQLAKVARGIKRFPMRSQKKSTRKAINFEKTVNERFHKCLSNLFSLSTNVQEYLSIGRTHYEKDFHLYRFWILNYSISLELAIKFMGKSMILFLLKHKLIEKATSNNTISSNVRLVPFQDQVYLTEQYDSSDDDNLYLSYDSLVLAEFLTERKIQGERVLDICCGSGILGITAFLNSPQSKHLTGIDLNARAYDFFSLNCDTNQVDSFDFHVDAHDSLLSKKLIEEADLIIFNPPFLPTNVAKSKTHSNGGRMGLELTLEIIDLIINNFSSGKRFCFISQTPGNESNSILKSHLRSLKNIDTNYHKLDAFAPFSHLNALPSDQETDSLHQVIVYAQDGSGLFREFDHSSSGEYCFA